MTEPIQRPISAKVHAIREAARAGKLTQWPPGPTLDGLLDTVRRQRKRGKSVDDAVTAALKDVGFDARRLLADAVRRLDSCQCARPLNNSQ